MNISTTVDSSIQTADLVLEAVSENMALKQKLFAEYDDKVCWRKESVSTVHVPGPGQDDLRLEHLLPPHLGDRLGHPQTGQVPPHKLLAGHIVEAVMVGSAVCTSSTRCR